jgi:hypothetical protein
VGALGRRLRTVEARLVRERAAARRDAQGSFYHSVGTGATAGADTGAGSDGRTGAWWWLPRADEEALMSRVQAEACTRMAAERNAGGHVRAQGWLAKCVGASALDDPPSEDA